MGTGGRQGQEPADGRGVGPAPPALPDRRRFLAGAAASAALVAVGCSGSDGDGRSGDGGPATGDRGATTSTTRHTARLASMPFTLGAASGDPLADRVVLWTRLAPDPLADDGLGGMPADRVDVVWEVAVDERFRSVVASGVATAEPDQAHAVHVDVTGLEPATDYFYRFRVGEWGGATGWTRTLPDGSPERFALAVANCQMRETGAWGAYQRMLEEDIDLVLHLGDYIYEYAGGSGPGASKPDRVLASLADYRLRYASYKLDPRLMAAHGRFPFVVTWDDHEVANNYMGDVVPGLDEAASKERKAAAYQAWWEHLPVRLDPPDGSDLPVHRGFTIGDLARLHVLDERQDAAVPPCRPTPDDTTDFGDCAAREGEDRSRLGAEQEAWLERSLAEGGVTWNLLGNPVVLAGVDAGRETAAYYLDTWDGFPAARRRLTAQLAAASNPVVLTGDYHAGMVLDVHADPFGGDPTVVAPELMAPAISSLLFDADVRARTPHLRQQLNEHGYLTVEVTPEALTARFRVVDDVADPDTAIRTAATWRVDAGDPVAKPV